MRYGGREFVVVAVVVVAVVVVVVARRRRFLLQALDHWGASWRELVWWKAAGSRKNSNLWKE